MGTRLMESLTLQSIVSLQHEASSVPSSLCNDVSLLVYYRLPCCSRLAMGVAISLGLTCLKCPPGQSALSSVK